MWHHTYGDALRRGDDLRADGARFRIGERARQCRTRSRERDDRDVTWVQRAAARAALAAARVALRLARAFDASVASDDLPGRVSAHRS